MGKRSQKEKRKHSAYYTPPSCMPFLWPHLPNKRPLKFAEPTCGDGRMIYFLEQHGLTCVFANDIAPQSADPRWVPKFSERWHLDILAEPHADMNKPDLIISNPPWDRDKDGTGPLHDMIAYFTSIAETWLLFDADWMHTQQASKFFLLHPDIVCLEIVPVGRVKWIEGSEHVGKDNACWYHFIKIDDLGVDIPTNFYFPEIR